MVQESRLFTPYKAIGLVSSGRPFLLRYIEKEKVFVLKVPVGNTVHIYSASKLALIQISDFHESAVTSITGGTTNDFTGTENGTIYCWSLFTTLVWKHQGHKAAIFSMVSVGNMLVSVDIENYFKVWDAKSGTLLIETDFCKDAFEITSIMHPPTYLNKIVIGSRQGKLKLYNLKTGRIIYDFEGWGSSVVVIEAAPALDIVAVGLEDGRIIVHNLKYDETLIHLKQDYGKVTSLAFRSDNYSLLLSGSATGHISIWNLEEKCLKSTKEEAHAGPIVSLLCAKGDPVAFTTSTDNVIKSWIFDMPDGGARLYVQRDGHSAPPLRVRYQGNDGLTLVSGGQDSTLRCSYIGTSKSSSMGLACYNRATVKKKTLALADKMPAIIDFTSETTRDEAWDGIAAIHRNSHKVSTWSFYKKAMNESILENKAVYKAGGVATCVEITACGNFVVIGYSSGHLVKYNIESGNFKLHYGKRAHNVAVKGVVTDCLNHWVVSGDQDGNLQWWGLHKGEKDKHIKLHGGITCMMLHRESGLFAASLDDWSIVVIDVDIKAICREFYGHYDCINDMTFSADSKWLISASMDHSIRSWHIPSGCCIDNFKVPTPATSIDFSPVEDYLVSTHIGELGIYVWANKNCLSYVSLQPLKDDFVPRLLTLPSSSPDNAHVEFDSDEDEAEEEMFVEEYKSPDQLSKDFVTIDVMPTPRWLNLTKIDQIKKRNKPIDAPKVPKSAPFFLESVAGIQNKQEEPGDNVVSRCISTGNSDIIIQDLSEFGNLLHNGDYDSAFEKLSKMNSFKIDMEIRNLDPEVGGSAKVMLNFLIMIEKIISSRKHFEVAQGYLSLFIKRHSDYIVAADDHVKEIFQNLCTSQIDSWRILENDINKSLSLLTFFKNSAILNY